VWHIMCSCISTLVLTRLSTVSIAIATIMKKLYSRVITSCWWKSSFIQSNTLICSGLVVQLSRTCQNTITLVLRKILQLHKLQHKRHQIIQCFPFMGTLIFKPDGCRIWHIAMDTCIYVCASKLNNFTNVGFALRCFASFTWHHVGSLLGMP